MRKTNKLRRKYTRKTKRRVPKGGMSGIAIREDIDKTKAINYFIENSTIEYVSEGSTGVTFVATLKPGFNSPYKSTDAETYGMDVKHLLLKLIFFKDGSKRSRTVRFEFDYNDKHNNVTLFLADRTTFQREIDIQNEVYANTMDYLEPICPTVVFSNMYNPNDFGIIETLLQSTVEFSNTYYLLKSMNNSFNTFGSVGIIGMEFAEGYHTLHYLRENLREKAKPEYKKTFTSTLSKVKPYHKQIQIYNNVGLYLILELALKTGYSHADFHGSNIMMRESNNSSYPYFLHGPNMKPLFIDFGLSVKIPYTKYDKIKKLCEESKYTAALKVLCTIPRQDKKRIDTTGWEHNYGWACNADEPRVNIEVAKLFAQRREAEKIVAYNFNQTHPKGPSLPLSNSAKQEVIDEFDEELCEKIGTPPEKYLDFDYMPNYASPIYSSSPTYSSSTNSISTSNDSPTQYSKELHTLNSPGFLPDKSMSSKSDI